MAAEKSGKEKLTPRQHAFVKNLAKGASQKDAFIAAGYKAKHPDQGAHQALKQIQDKVPQIMDEMGLEGKKRINVPALGIRHNALDTAFKLRGSYAPRDPKEAEQFGIKVLIVDISRRHHATQSMSRHAWPAATPSHLQTTTATTEDIYPSLPDSGRAERYIFF